MGAWFETTLHLNISSVCLCLLENRAANQHSRGTMMSLHTYAHLFAWLVEDSGAWL